MLFLESELCSVEPFFLQVCYGEVEENPFLSSLLIESSFSSFIQPNTKIRGNYEKTLQFLFPVDKEEKRGSMEKEEEGAEIE